MQRSRTVRSSGQPPPSNPGHPRDCLPRLLAHLRALRPFLSERCLVQAVLVGSGRESWFGREGPIWLSLWADLLEGGTPDENKFRLGVRCFGSLGAKG
eukprot:14530629-Alexandrium_andersonii.AAC.1